MVTLGDWDIYGADTNTDMGGSHIQPYLGTVKGCTLADAVATAKAHKSWADWGQGGRIEKSSRIAYLDVVKAPVVVITGPSLEQVEDWMKACQQLVDATPAGVETLTNFILKGLTPAVFQNVAVKYKGNSCLGVKGDDIAIRVQHIACTFLFTQARAGQQ